MFSPDSKIVQPEQDVPGGGTKLTAYKQRETIAVPHRTKPASPRSIMTIAPDEPYGTIATRLSMLPGEIPARRQKSPYNRLTFPHFGAAVTGHGPFHLQCFHSCLCWILAIHCEIGFTIGIPSATLAAPATLFPSKSDETKQLLSTSTTGLEQSTTQKTVRRTT